MRGTVRSAVRVRHGGLEAIDDIPVERRGTDRLDEIELIALLRPLSPEHGPEEDRADEAEHDHDGHTALPPSHDIPRALAVGVLDLPQRGVKKCEVCEVAALA
jgi:hypothetical protein